MPSLKDDFNEVMERVRSGRELGHASYEPVYYLVYHPRQIMEVKRQLPAWKAKLKNDGWEVETLSVVNEVASILKNAPIRKIWETADAKNPLDWDKTNKSLANALSKGALLKRFEDALAGMEGKEKALLLVTDLEGLHPYMRIGSIEGQLHGKFIVPTIFLYPGIRTGQSRLKFLGFYPEDGNYRSVHVGG